MMDASEAKAKSDDWNDRKDENQLIDIQKRVEYAVAKGAYACSLASEPSVNLKKKLVALGYTVKSFSDQRSGEPDTVTLSWA